MGPIDPIDAAIASVVANVEGFMTTLEVKLLSEVGGVAVGVMSGVAAEMAAIDAAAAGANAACSIANVTRGGSVPNIQIGLSRPAFEQNLLNSGFRMRSVGGNGNVSLFERGATRYAVRDVAKSHAGPSADVTVGGKTVLKIRLK